MFKPLRRNLALVLAILLALCGFIADAETQGLALGARGEEVRALQEQLIALGYLDGDADSTFGTKTEAALRAFQATVGLLETGILDAETQEALFSPYAPTSAPAQNSESGEMVWIPKTGQRYHSSKTCSGMKDPSYVTIEEAIRRGFTPCKKCYS